MRKDGGQALATACSQELQHREQEARLQMAAQGASYFDLEFKRLVKYDWVHRWVREHSGVDRALWKLVQLLSPAGLLQLGEASQGNEDKQAVSAAPAAPATAAHPSAASAAPDLSAASAAPDPAAATAAPRLLALKMATQWVNSRLGGNPQMRV